jgi:hypothetical protein
VPIIGSGRDRPSNPNHSGEGLSVHHRNTLPDSVSTDTYRVISLPRNSSILGRELGIYQNLSLWLKRHAVVASIIVIICSLGMRLFITLRSDQAMLIKDNADAATYLVPAQNLLKHGSFLNRYNNPEISRTPGYPVFVSAIILLVGQDWRKVLVMQTVVLSFNVLVSYWVATTIFSPLPAFVGALLAAFSPWGAVHAGLPLTEGLYLLVLSLILFSMKLLEHATRRFSLFLGGGCVGLLTGAAVMVRPIWPLVIVIGLAIIFLYGPKKKGVWLLLTTMLVFSVTPILLWKERNRHGANYNGFSDIAGETALYYLASRVRAYVQGQDPWAVKDQIMSEEKNRHLSDQKADEERWRQANAVFGEHPVLTVYFLVLSAAEHVIHPSPDVLRPAGLNFYGDFWFLGFLWGGLLSLAGLGLRSSFDGAKTPSANHRWICAILGICLLLTLAGGISFGQGSRLRVSLELIIPFMAAEGLLCLLLGQRQTVDQLDKALLPLKMRPENQLVREED